MTDTTWVDQSKNSPLLREVNLGQAIARLYIAAQHTSQEASGVACTLMETATPAMRGAFNYEMSKTPYRVRAEPHKDTLQRTKEQSL